MIFDLDDTLIDTFGCSQPVKFKIALQKMIKAGLRVDNEEMAYQRLMGINDTTPNGKETVRLFLEEVKQFTTHLFTLGVDAYYGGEQLDFPINPLPGALSVLTSLARNHTLALVSYGQEAEQFGKLKKAGITQEIFHKIIITDEYNKREQYKRVARELNFPFEQCLVCGDKLVTDLLPAQELGMITVQMIWGRAALQLSKSRTQRTGKAEADHAIHSLQELPAIVHQEEAQWKQ